MLQAPMGMLTLQVEKLFLTNFFMQELLQDIALIKQQLVLMQEMNTKLLQGIRFLYDVQEIRVGAGDRSLNVDKNGLRMGKSSWAYINNGGVPLGTGIGMDGTFYGKDGLTGTITIPAGGGSFTVKKGIVI